MKRTWAILHLVFVCATAAYGQQLPRLRVSHDKRHLVTDDNRPFLWLGCTAWELIHRATREEVDLYLADRAAKGFTVVQTVILAELDGLRTPNAYGHLPLVNLDPTQPDEAYFEHVDYVVKRAADHGLYVALLPTWGDKFNLKWGQGPEVFTPANARAFGELVARRYASQSNVIWVLGGDRVPEDENHYAVVRSMANGIRLADTLPLLAYHPSGGRLASAILNDPWLDLDMFQSGHDRNAKEYRFVSSALKVEPRRPVINAEARYENIPDRFWDAAEVKTWLDDSDVRASAYWSLLAGAAGYTYGCNDIWQMWAPGREPQIQARTGWKEALHLPGSGQMRHLRDLFSAFPWHTLRVDQSAILNPNPEDDGYMLYAASTTRDFSLLYNPSGRAVTLDTRGLDAEEVEAYWFNPRSGRAQRAGQARAQATLSVKPWAHGRGSDFVLIVVDEKATYAIPGL